MIDMVRSNFTDWFKQYLPQPNVPETKGILFVDPKHIEDFEDDGLDDDDIELLQEVVAKEEVKEEFDFVDLTMEPRTKERGEAKGKRKWKNIKSICLHQTAVDFGTNPRRMLNVPVHGATLRNGKVILLHTPTHYMWHAHSLNKESIGIEVSCRTAGVHRVERTFWLSKKEKQAGKTYPQLVSDPTKIQIEATKELCRYYIELVGMNGGEIEYIRAHRQGHESRTGDPGSIIWEEVGIPIMEEFGLSCGPIGWTIGSGTPIPQIWDKIRGKGIRYSGSYKGL